MNGKLQDLISRVEKASGGDRELDAAITVALYPGATLQPDAFEDIPIEAGHYWRPMRGGHSLAAAEPLTSSIDAALALVERVLPGAHVRIESVGAPWSQWEVSLEVDHDPLSGLPRTVLMGSNRATPPLAILSALLNALKALDASAS